MYFLAYVSKAIKGIGDNEIGKLLDKAKVNNSLVNVTGMLLFRSGTFFQLLEGEKKSVLMIFQKISQDPRHEKIKILLETEIADANRIFPSWEMGLIQDRLAVQEQEALIRSIQTMIKSGKSDKEKILQTLKIFSSKQPSSARSILLKSKGR